MVGKYLFNTQYTQQSWTQAYGRRTKGGRRLWGRTLRLMPSGARSGRLSPGCDGSPPVNAWRADRYIPRLMPGGWSVGTVILWLMPGGGWDIPRLMSRSPLVNAWRVERDIPRLMPGGWSVGTVILLLIPHTRLLIVHLRQLN